MDPASGGARGSLGSPPVAVGDGYGVNVYDMIGTVVRDVVDGDASLDVVSPALEETLTDDGNTEEVRIDDSVALDVTTVEAENV